VTLALALVAWQAGVVLFEAPAFLVPSPGAVARAASQHHARLVDASWVTFTEAITGFSLATVLGTALAFLFTRARWVERSLVPYAVFLQTVPVVAMAPLLVLWFGSGFRSVVAASLIVSVFPVITAAIAGLRSVDPDLRALFRLYRATRWQTFWRLEVPSAVPFLLAGLRSASGLAVIGAVVGEFVAGHSEGSPGLGYLILEGTRQMQTALLFAAILCCSLLGLLLFGTASLAGRRWLSRWHASTSAE
jgi:NitT/TauT family transport system permease protein